MLDLLARLDRDRIEPILATSPGGPLVDRARALGIQVLSLDLTSDVLHLSREEWGRNPWAFAWRARTYVREVDRIARFMREHGVAFLHTNTLKAHVLGSLAAMWARRPIVWHMRDLPSSRGDARALLGTLFKLVNPGIVAISRAVANDLPPAMRARTRVVYNGVDLEAFDQTAIPATDLPLPAGDGPVIGTVSYLIPWKGQEVFLRAAAALAPAHPGWRFLLVGDPIFQFRAERERLQGLAAELGIADRVAFAGHREDVPAVMSAMDVFVLPSLYEPFGRVLIEAMAAWRPIVASRAGGVPEIVLDGDTGVLVPPGEPEALADAIAAVVIDRDRAAALGAAARRRVEKHFSLESTVAGVLEAYEAFGLVAPGPEPVSREG
ncbi:D-inositol 3-phosphate glycosyltransferase [compost metagenome]